MFTKEIGLNYILLEGNSLAVVQAVKAQSEDLSNIGAFIHSIRLILRSFTSDTCTHIRRQGNQLAHVIERMALQEESCIY